MMRVAAAAAGGSQPALTAESFGGTEDFMTLLVAQLQTQDPMDPMDSSEFMNQLTSLQSVAELQGISSLLAEQGRDVSEALAMIDRTVCWRDAATGEQREGVVESVDLSGDACRLVVDDARIGLDEVQSVSN